MLWAWLLKYSFLLVTATLTVVGTLIVHWLTQRWPQLYFYITNVQWVQLPSPPAEQVPANTPTALGTGTLFLNNQGKAPARNVLVGHFAQIPAHNVWPNLPRNTITLQGGAQAIQFPVIPPKTLITISYLVFPPVTTVEQIVAYVTADEGAAKRIPVIIQRQFPGWVIKLVGALTFAGLWVAINAVFALIRFLWINFHF